MIIYLISGPRNCSTALMYSFNQRPDTVVIDEPFYGLWLKRIGKIQPHYDEIMLTLQYNGNANNIHDRIEENENIKGNVFVKNMANTVEDMNKDRILNYCPVFLIRDPVEVIMSHIKVDPYITGEDLCLEHQVKIYDWFKEKTREDPIVINGNELRKNPRSILIETCRQVNIPYTDEMLSWPVGPKSIDGVWASAWYSEVHKSTGFSPPPSTKLTRNDIPRKYVALYDEVLPYYQKLLSHSIQA
ncbi:unnamed protein product [Rotaria sp. Silwood1]|nr:unnamed protein product [Rotaria sp. Silwood1]CAF3514759.1 unnamed protein product [Rotaria sp. Silwood1]